MTTGFKVLVCALSITLCVANEMPHPRPLLSLSDNATRKNEVCHNTSVDNGIFCGGISLHRWYYDSETESCQLFLYWGCGGNDNNFIEREFCRRYCGVKVCPYGGEPARTNGGRSIKTCLSSSDCASEYICQQVRIRGDPRTKFCCPLKSLICSLPKREGTACGNTQSVNRFYYDFQNRTCEPFQFQGCAGGNANNFETEHQCDLFCQSSACLAGERLLKDGSNDQPLKCSSLTSCPIGYTCRMDYLTGDRVCCGTGQEEVCPRGYQAFIEESSNLPKFCPRGHRDCPADYACFPTDFKNKFVFACCRPIV